MHYSRPQDLPSVPKSVGTGGGGCKGHIDCSSPASAAGSFPVKLVGIKNPANTMLRKYYTVPYGQQKLPEHSHPFVCIILLSRTWMWGAIWEHRGRAKGSLKPTLCPTTDWDGTSPSASVYCRFVGKYSRLNRHVQITERWHFNDFLPFLAFTNIQQKSI